MENPVISPVSNMDKSLKTKIISAKWTAPPLYTMV